MLACHGSSGPPYGHTSERKRSGKQDGGRSLARGSESSSDAAKLVAVAYYAGDDMVATVACPVPLFSFFLLSRSAGHRLLAACGVGLEGWGCCAVFPP